MSDKPKRRWYQFSLRTLLLVMAVVSLVLGTLLPWQSHRRFCLERAAAHESSIGDFHSLHIQFVSDLLGDDDKVSASLAAQVEAALERHRKQDESHKALAAAYLHAIWRPWERPWIDDSLPPDKGLPEATAVNEEFAKFFQAIRDKEQRHAPDAVLRKLADESREKYGVP